MKRNVYLIGMMGSGKSVVSRILAAKLKREHVDLDDEITRDQGRTVREIFAQEGEAFFREREQMLLKKVSKKQGLIVATGGGVVTCAENLKTMRETGVLFYLKASTDVLQMHIGRDTNRPLLQGINTRERLEAILSERKHAYERADFVVTVDGKNPDEVAELIQGMLKERGTVHEK